ncbi:MAG TPA: GAP family protein [Nitrospirota bacterium]|nr:GAP family protein [Nitrospirota bacterium]HYA90176.1 GAP family protein [Thermodesulfobacteriota bacterium]
MGGFMTVLPMAFVMVAGPQIVSAVFIATSKNWLRNCLMFLLGVTVASVMGTGVAYLGYTYFAQGTASAGRGLAKLVVNWVIVALLLLLAVRVYLKRKDTQPPKWMGRLQNADAAFAFRIAFLLFLLMPTDIVSTVTVGLHLARSESPYWHVVGFIAATLLLAGIPLILNLLLGRRAETLLPRVREWMNTDSWIVSEIVVAFFLMMAVRGIAQG